MLLKTVIQSLQTDQHYTITNSRNDSECNNTTAIETMPCLEWKNNGHKLAVAKTLYYSRNKSIGIDRTATATTEATAAGPRKTNGQYLLSLQVSGYCLLTLQSRSAYSSNSLLKLFLSLQYLRTFPAATAAVHEKATAVHGEATAVGKQQRCMGKPSNRPDPEARRSP